MCVCARMCIIFLCLGVYVGVGVYVNMTLILRALLIRPSYWDVPNKRSTLWKEVGRMDGWTGDQAWKGPLTASS